MALGDGTEWDEGAPITTEPRADGADEIRDLRKGVKIRINKEHVTLATDSAGGEHLNGSAKAYYENPAPTDRPDPDTPTALVSTDDDGRLWIDSDDDVLYHWADNAFVETGTRSKGGEFDGPDVTDFNAGTTVTIDFGFVPQWFWLTLRMTDGIMLSVAAPVGLDPSARVYRFPRDVSNTESVTISRSGDIVSVTKITANISDAYWLGQRHGA